MIDILPRILLRKEEFVIYDEKSNTLYVTDEATYNQWNLRKESVDSTKFRKAT